MKSLQNIVISSVFIMALFLLAAVVKGKPGNPVYYQTERSTDIGGPFELSNSTARFALTESIVENGTPFLTKEQAAFASPDVVYYNGKFFSIFTPGVSFFAIPFYILGKTYGLQQLFAYFAVTLVAFANIFLIAKIAMKFGARIYASIIAGFVYLFGTNALSYSLNFTQHNVSSALLLLAILNAFEKRTWLSNLSLGIIVGIATLVDVPNLVLIAPVVLYILVKHYSVREERTRFAVSLNMKWFSIVAGAFLLFGVFAYYNHTTAGSYVKLAQNIGRTDYFSKTAKNQNKLIASDNNPNNNGLFNLSLPFNTRLQMNGAYILALSDERAWWFYSPVLFVGLLGWWLLCKQRKNAGLVAACVGIIALNYVLYSMFGDPWGGWSFGPRYLIPAASITAIGIAFAIEKYKQKIVFFVLFLFLFMYSTIINFAGALTTSAIPPKIEAIHFEKFIPWTYEYNINFIQNDMSSSLFYNFSLVNIMQPIDYLIILSFISGIIVVVLFSLSLFVRKDQV